ncbi:hypothetical protein OIV83_001692 [Microbotryomycetes sp. JL201]|nr:hypothetical protein OIV83_001692 [Microbotryomycetes sp. JL201]
MRSRVLLGSLATFVTACYATSKAQYPLMASDRGGDAFASGQPTLADRLSVHASQASIFYDYCRSSASVATMLGAAALPGNPAGHTVIVPVNKAIMSLARKPHQGPLPSPSTSPDSAGQVHANDDGDDDDEDKAAAAFLEAFVKRHIITGLVPWERPQDIEGRQFETMHASDTVEFKQTEDGWLVNGVTILDRDDLASNGDILFVDGVLSLEGFMSNTSGCAKFARSPLLLCACGAMTTVTPLVDSTWKQSDTLPVDRDDDEWEEDEVCYLTLDFGKLPTGAVTNGELQLLGLNSDTPFARVGGSIFRGQHEQLIGSEIFLDRNRKSQQRTDKGGVLIYFSTANDGTVSPLPRTTSARVRFEPVKLVSKADIAHGISNVERNTVNQTSKKSRGTGRPRGRPRKFLGETRAEAVQRRKAQRSQKDGGDHSATVAGSSEPGPAVEEQERRDENSSGEGEG